MSPRSHRRICDLTEYQAIAIRPAIVRRIVRMMNATALRTAASMPNAAASNRRSTITQAMQSSYELLGETFDAPGQPVRMLERQIVDPVHP